MKTTTISNYQPKFELEHLRKIIQAEYTEVACVPKYEHVLMYSKMPELRICCFLRSERVQSYWQKVLIGYT